MRQCKVITVNDGKERELTDGDRLYICDHPVTERCINEYLEEGWSIVQMCPVINPAINQEGSYTFYRGGYTFYLEREISV